MVDLLLPFVASAVVTLMIVRSAHLHCGRSGDRDFSKPQKVHVVPVPRIGGLGIVLGLGFSVGWWALDGRADLQTAGLLLLACAAPAFLAGFIQDFTEAVTPRGRLLATALAAVAAFVWLDTGLVRTDIPGLDWMVGFTLGSLALTVLTVAGIANAINIIDGFNGLASMCVMLMLGAVAYVAFQAGDLLVGSLALAAIGAVAGFFVWNYPAGLIFLGDGGAYFLGFVLAELSLLLIKRNPGEVSPLFPLLVCIYPVFETLFSMYRRRVLRAMPPSLPDGIHLHSLIYRRLMRWAVGNSSAKALTRRNSMTSPYLWMLCSLSLVPAVTFWGSSGVLALFLAAFGVLYVALYWRIVRFKSPRWMRFPPSRPRCEATGDNRRT
ncbi:glycosyl transferase [Rubrivivax sp. JA1024]|nr:glycosyl transferase [Rubrivivax sp. JA1024]